MPFTLPGRDIRVVENKATGRLDFTFESTTGNFEFDDTGAHAVASVLMEHRGEWWADTTGTRGSRLHTVKNIRSTTRSEIIAYSKEALKELEDAGTIQSDPVVDVRMKPTGAILEVKFIGPDGEETDLPMAL